jgi:uncharacterized membrane protein
MKTETLWEITKYIAIAGIALAVYLLWQQMFRPAWQPCSINATVNCDAIVKGPVANTLGIPTPLYGLIGYIVILIASMKQWRRVLLGTAIFGLVFCLRVFFIEIFQLKVICPVCIGCQVLMIGATITSVLLHKNIDSTI